MWMLSFKVVLGYQGLLYSQTNCDFLFRFFQTDRPSQYQETHSTLNEKKQKKNGLIYKRDILFQSFIISTRTCRLWTSPFRVFLKIDSLQVYAIVFIREKEFLFLFLNFDTVF